MTKGQRNKAKFGQALETEYSLQADRWGNYKFTSMQNLYRFKMQRQSCRLEVKQAGNWIRLQTISSGKLHIDNFRSYLKGCLSV